MQQDLNRKFHASHLAATRTSMPTGQGAGRELVDRRAR